MRLPSLRELDIHYNRIVRLPADLGPLKGLRKIHVRANGLPAAEVRRPVKALGRDVVVLK